MKTSIPCEAHDKGKSQGKGQSFKVRSKVDHMSQNSPWFSRQRLEIETKSIETKFFEAEVTAERAACGVRGIWWSSPQAKHNIVAGFGVEQSQANFVGFDVATSRA